VNYNGKPMPRAYIMSPLRADTAQGTALNVAYAKLAMLHSMVVHHESPYVPHLLLTQALRDSVPAQRALGMAAGKAWIAAADLAASYEDLGVSAGMRGETEAAMERNVWIEHRRIFPFERRPTLTEILLMIDSLEAQIG